MPRKLKPRHRKSFVELTETINAIPKGVYRLAERDGHSVTLCLGSKIYVGLIGDTKEYLVNLTEREGRARRMSQQEFLTRYYALLREMSGRLPDFSRPFTYCMLDPSLARECH